MRKEFEIAGISFEAWTPEEAIELFVKIRNECHRRNEANPNLIRLNSNTWVVKNDR
jgi:hypothetical protein